LIGSGRLALKQVRSWKIAAARLLAIAWVLFTVSKYFFTFLTFVKVLFPFFLVGTKEEEIIII
jgi:hypothetical protein